MTENTQIIEVNGIKMEVDMRYATRVDNFKIGSKVKLLEKDYSSWKSHYGVIVGFDDFKKLPTIIVAYLVVDYSGAELKFAYINNETDKYELILSVNDELPLNKDDLLESFNKERLKLTASIEELDRKESYFLRHFNQYFNDYKLHEEA